MSDFLARMVDRAAGRARPVEPVMAPRWGNVTPLEAPPQITTTVESGVVQRMPASAVPAPQPSLAHAAAPSRAVEPAPGSAARPIVESERAHTPARAIDAPPGDATAERETTAPLRPIVRAPMAVEEELQIQPAAPRAHADAIEAARPNEAARSIEVARAVEPLVAARPAAPFAPPASFAPPAVAERALAPHETSALAPAPFAQAASSPVHATPSALRANATSAVEPAAPRAAPTAAAPRFDLTQALQAAVRALSTPPRAPAPAAVDAAADEIHISIGRVDVRATPPAERPAPPARPSHLKSLDDYLRAPFGSKT
jgi:hypothetical protein